MKAEEDLRLDNRSVLGLDANFYGPNQWADGGFGFASFTAADTIFPAATSMFADKLGCFGTVRPARAGFDAVPRAKFQGLCTLVAQAAAQVHAEIEGGPVVGE